MVDCPRELVEELSNIHLAAQSESAQFTGQNHPAYHQLETQMLKHILARISFRPKADNESSIRKVY